ncbi:MAG: hypothetical protein HY077_04030 [Elusimicrobia bacterium]|nr:hypothetical protein [Elusimicrobiota bacterium]
MRTALAAVLLLLQTSSWAKSKGAVNQNFGSFGDESVPAQLGDPTRPTYTNGVYGSTRFHEKQILDDPKEKVEDEHPAAPTVEDARGSFQTLVESFVRAKRGEDGTVAVRDPASGRGLPLRMVRADSASVRAAGNGLFAGEVIMRTAAGKTVRATAVADLGSTEWRITSLELAAKRKVLQANDVGRLFAAAVLAHIQDGARREGVFFLPRDSGPKRRRLKLKTIPAAGFAPLGEGRYRSTVTMVDLDDGASVEVDFYASLADGAGQVYKTALHESAGQP